MTNRSRLVVRVLLLVKELKASGLHSSFGLPPERIPVVAVVGYYVQFMCTT